MAKRHQKQTRKSTKIHDIKNLDIAIATVFPKDGVHNAEVLTQADSMILSNPMEYIDELTKLNPFWGTVALRVMTSAFGWYAVSAILWEYRKRNQAPKVTSSIDWLNDTINEIKEKQEAQTNFEEQGHNTLPFVQGLKLVGAYKYLYMLTANADDIRSMDMPTPAVLFERMRSNERDRSEVLAAYEAFDTERFKDSPNFAHVKERLERNKKTQDERAVKKAQDELDHIHFELASTPHEILTDAVWMQVPLWAQFRLIRSIYKQVISAIANELEKPADERLALEDLHKLGNTIHAELSAADRNPEVRLAFEKKILDHERHGLSNAA